MTIRFFNTLSGKKEILSKPRGRELRLFVCGQTVYDHAHLGHARTYAAFDTIVKYLRGAGFKIKYIQNITDIDDKIIQRAKERNQTPRELADYFIKAFHEDMGKIGVDSVDLYPKTSDFMEEVVSQIETLIKKKFAYQTKSGIYFEVRRFKNYGKLSGQNLDELRPGYRIEPDPEKKDPLDFALWKFRDEEPFWPSPWGNGRPGWHIEDTAITNKIFGPQYDVHGGANELKFPHHEAEIAQQESATGKSPMVKLWIHTGLLLVDGEKMSKSLKNFITIRDFLKKWPPNVLRWIIANHHYSQPINYTESLAAEASGSLSKIDNFLGKLNLPRKNNAVSANVKKHLKAADAGFHAAMADDMNTPKAVAVLFGLMSDMESEIWQLNSSESADIGRFIISKLAPLGIKMGMEPCPPEILKLAEERENFRLRKNFSKADELRKKIFSLGFDVEDTPLGAYVRKKSL